MTDNPLFLILIAAVIIVGIIAGAAVEVSKNHRCTCWRKGDDE